MSRVFSKVICVVALSSLVVHAQDKSVIATSTNLSEALSAKQWTNVESSVDQGLKWLASQQQEDGRFPSEDLGQPAVTSFTVMAFLSRGHLPDQGPHGKTVSKAIDFVLSTQHRQGYFSLLPVAASAEHGTPAQVVTYNHAIAGLMLGEVYGMCSGDRSKRIEQALHRALTYHRKVQARVKTETNLKGGWRYGFPESPNASSDLSVTGWALMFYRSARNAEFDIPKQYYEEGLDFVERCYGGNGMFRYQPETGQFSLANTASGTLTLILGGRQDSPSVLATTNYFRSRRYPKPGAIC